MLNLLIEKDVRIWNRSSFLAMYSITSHADMDLQHSEKIVFYVALFFTSTHEQTPLCPLGNITLIAMNRTNFVMRFCCQIFWCDAPLCVEPVPKPL
jgi:hypothetical protein